ncbi:hypothetical protein GCM10022254_13980 [Actinomadura meridiana]|uniref:Uncharacterized protein n=1 Tax=Actinomadura meridiana TaxID=559626 RepID=A0ABP8BV43_9ACTN
MREARRALGYRGGRSPDARRVPPAAEAITVLTGAGVWALLVIIDAAETPYDGLADAVLRRPIGETLPRLAGLALGTEGRAV